MTDTNPYSFGNFVSFLTNNFAILFLVVLAFASGFFIGSLWTERQMLSAGGVKTTATAPAAPSDPAAAAPTGPTADQLSSVPPVTDEDHQRGNKNAKITLIEYSDFECPFCKSFFLTLEKVREEYGNDVRVVYRHYPLPFHPQAQPLAEASECVAKQEGQDAFWAFHDALFTTAGEISATTALDVAEQVGANRQAVKDCMDKGEMKQKVTDQMTGGSSAGVNGTPGTIVVTQDGQFELISGALPFEQVQQVLNKYL